MHSNNTNFIVYHDINVKRHVQEEHFRLVRIIRNSILASLNTMWIRSAIDFLSMLLFPAYYLTSRLRLRIQKRKKKKKEEKEKITGENHSLNNIRFQFEHSLHRLYILLLLFP